MKTTAMRAWTAVCLSGLMTTVAMRAFADDADATVKRDKAYTGTLTSVDPKERVLNVKGLFLNKKFNLGDSCKFRLLDNSAGTAESLRAGQRVVVYYQDAEGVNVADRVEQKPLRFEGTVKTIDADRHMMTVHVRGKDMEFVIAEACRVMLHGDKSGSLGDVQPGHHVTVLYEVPNNLPTARLIEQTSATFVGAVTAIDLNERTVKAKAMFGSKKFNLGEGCQIVLNGKTDGELRDLKPGDNLVFNYEEVNGVNVVNRIATAEPTKETVTAK